MIHPRRHLERFDLFVFDPGLGADFVPKIIDVSESISESELQFAANLVSVTAPLRYIWEQAPQAARESLRDGKQPFSVLLAASPGYEKLFVPSSPLDVYSVSIGQHSTAGVVVEDLTKQGRIGVTAARHGIGSKPSKVTVNGQTGTVVRVHEITDSAFIEVPRPTRAAKSTHGIMRGFAPRGNQNADFVGVTTAKTTRIMTWDPQVPDPSPVRQACVYTGRDAQPGDSGCALVTDDDWIVGFAFERTIPGANPIYCSWIWAESVMNGLQVKLVLVGRSE
jgi:hypothetical protein